MYILNTDIFITSDWHNCINYLLIYTDKKSITHSLLKHTYILKKTIRNLSTMQYVNPFTLRAAKEAWQIRKYFTYKSIFLTTFEGGMLIRSQTTTLLQIFYEILLCSQVIFKSMKVADDTFQRNSECQYVKKYLTKLLFPMHSSASLNYNHIFLIWWGTVLTLNSMTGNGHKELFKVTSYNFHPQEQAQTPILSCKPVYHILPYLNIPLLCSYFQ